VYLRLTLRFHPDKWPPSDRTSATQLFQAIGAVYTELLGRPRGGDYQRRVKTPAAAAAELGDLEELRRLLEERPSRANEADDNNVTPLMLAAKGGSLPAAALLLAYGASADADTPLGWTAMTFAALHDQYDMVRFLVSKGLPVTEEDLLLAAFTGNPKGLQGLLELYPGHLQNVRASGGQTMLHYACSGMLHVVRDNPERYLSCVELLLLCGVPIDAIDSRRGRTCLQTYVSHRRWHTEGYERSSVHLDLVELLCSQGASPTACDSEGSCAISIVKASGLSMVQDVFERFSQSESGPIPHGEPFYVLSRL